MLGVLFALAILTLAIWLALLNREGSGILTVHFLDIGQGDSILIESPTGAQVLIDGGPSREVLRQLGEVMSWNDRSIDVVIATHPDADHVVGLVDVLQRYEVAYIFEPGVRHDAPHVEPLLASVANEGAQYLLARRGQRINIGGGAYIDILFPDRDVSTLETNTASIVARLVYGTTSFMLTGDSPSAIEKYLVRTDAKGLDSDVLKAGHHGSNTSTSQEFIDAVSPTYAVFSRGCDNTYGHPHADVVARLAAAAVATLDTCENGRVTFTSDGTTLERQ